MLLSFNLLIYCSVPRLNCNTRCSSIVSLNIAESLSLLNLFWIMPRHSFARKLLVGLRTKRSRAILAKIKTSRLSNNVRYFCSGGHPSDCSWTWGEEISENFGGFEAVQPRQRLLRFGCWPLPSRRRQRGQSRSQLFQFANQIVTALTSSVCLNVLS